MVTSLILAAVLLRPNPVLTPGATRGLTTATVCSTKWGLDRRHVTERMKRDVFTAYGIPWETRKDYEVDHFIPRELGGADAVANLWPEKWDGARKKDRLENRLHRMVCAGQMSLTFAVEAITSDWVAAYRLYVEAH